MEENENEGVFNESHTPEAKPPSREREEIITQDRALMNTTEVSYCDSTPCDGGDGFRCYKGADSRRKRM